MAKNVQIINPVKQQVIRQLQPKKRVCAYCRVSTDSREQHNSFSVQMEYYKTFIENQEDWEFAGIYADEAQSGTKLQKRDEFLRMLKDCENGQIDMIITKSVTRFARNTVDSIQVIRRLKEHGIAVYFEKEHINSLSEKSEQMLTILSSLAQGEAESNSTNNRWATVKRFQDGTFILSCPAYGYTKNENGELIIQKEEAAVVRRIFRDYLNGKGTYLIAKELTDEHYPTIRSAERWNDGVIKEILLNPIYAGNLLFQKTYTLKGYMEADAVIRAKAADMLEHYIGTVFQNGFKAQVAAFDREAAYRYKRAFEELLAAKITDLKANNPDGIDIALLEKMKVECIISLGTDDANRHPHLKALVDSTDKDAIVGEEGSFKTPFVKGGYTGIVIVSDMLLTGFDAPIEQVLYLDMKLVNHNLLQAIARVNRTCGKDKTCGYVVDYVGITQHLKEALSEYASLEGVSEEDKEPMLSIAEDVDRLNSAYNEILTFVRDEVCYDISTQTESVIEELVAVEELRDEYNDLFKKLSKYYDRVLPNPVALQYRDGYKQLAFIRESVANRTRDPRHSMKDASAKVRAIIEEYLAVSGVGVEVPPIDILSPDFIAGVGKPDKTDRAVVDELEYAVREYIIENTPRDPELFERFSEHLNEILESLKGNWKELRKALEKFIKTDLFNARNTENTYGYESVKEMPFFSLLRKEVFGDKKFEDFSLKAIC